MPHAEYDPVTGTFTVTTVWNEKELIQGIPGARWDAQATTWRVPGTWASLVTLRGVFHAALTLGDSAKTRGWEIRQDRVDPALLKRAEIEPDPGDDTPLLDALYPFQAAGVQFMSVAQSGLLGDDMGLGKTIQILGLIDARQRQVGDGVPALIICPNSVKHQWAEAVERWLPWATPYTVDGSAAQRRKILATASDDPTAIVIINIESVRLFSRLAPYGSVKLSRCRKCDPKYGDENLKTSRCDVHQKELNKIPFKLVALDEAHRCFPYDTPVLTDVGWVPIGDVVEHQRGSMMLSYSPSGTAEWKPITNRWKNPLSQLVRVRHTYGELICTSTHKIWAGDGYTRAGDLTVGQELRILSDTISAQAQERSLLHQDVQQPIHRACEKSADASVVRAVRQHVRSEKEDESILLSCVQQQAHDGRSRDESTHRVGKSERKDRTDVPVVHGDVQGFAVLQEQNVLLSIVQLKAQARDDSESHGRSASRREDEEGTSRPRSLSEDLHRWKWSRSVGGTTTSCEATRLADGSHRVDEADLGSARDEHSGTQSLQGRRSEPGVHDRDRSGWSISHVARASTPRREENPRTYTSRVESVEVYEPGDSDVVGGSTHEDHYLYDVEVADNHNYFANGVLVSNCKEPKSQQTRAIWYVGHQPGVKVRWGLTGTPIANHPGDLWSIMHFTNPEEFPTRGKFVDRFCLSAWNAQGTMDIVGIRPDTREEFFRILDPRFRRTLKAVVLTQLPPRIREIRYATLSTPQRRMYNELSASLVTRTPDGQLLLAPTQLAATTRLMQLAAASVKVEKPNPDDPSTWQVLLTDPSPKLDVLEEVLDEIGVLRRHYDGAPVLVAAEHLQLIKLAAKRIDSYGIRYGMITGEVAPVDRRTVLAELNSRQIRVLLFTGKAGGVGLNMTAADTLVNIQRSWSLVDEHQKEDRNYRIGSEIHEAIRIIDIVTEGTVEIDQIKRLHEKLARLEEITRDKAALLRVDPHATTFELDQEENLILSTYLGLPSAA